MSPLYMIKSHGAWEGGGREPNKPTGVRHAILLTQTAGTSCSQIKHLNFYCAEQPRKNRRKSSLPLQRGTWKVSAGFWHQGNRQPKAGPHLAHVLLAQALLLPGQGLGVTAAGQLDTQTHTAGAQPISPGREYGLELRAWEFSIISYPGSGAGAPGFKHYYIIPLRKFFHSLFPNATSKEGMHFPF